MDDPVNREKDDFYPTHPGATEALLSVEQFDAFVWEPACGEGDMSRVLEAHDYSVLSEDLIDRGYGNTGHDFLLAQNLKAKSVVTNPPFKLALEFCEHAISLGAHKTAMFLRLAFLEGIKRKTFFEKHPPARVWVMSRRVPMQRGRLSQKGDGHGVMAFAWFVWERGFTGAPTVGFLDWKDHAPPTKETEQRREAEVVV
ncbi:MAG: hypothetical protein AAGB23_05360 [Pseudomonadota bacterium]